MEVAVHGREEERLVHCAHAHNSTRTIREKFSEAEAGRGGVVGGWSVVRTAAAVVGVVEVSRGRRHGSWLRAREEEEGEEASGSF